MKLKMINKILNYFLLILLAVFAVSFFMRYRLPVTTDILPELSQDPVQTPVSIDSFDFDYRGTNYYVFPQAEYELWGLIVGRNNISKFGDIYHDEDSVDLVDVCVVWGSNVESDLYRKIKFKSGSWTCYWSSNDTKIWRAFNEFKVSNNHLITSDLALQDQIRNLHQGDQIHIKGYLVDYTNMETDWMRQTSMNRTDTGNGACEVVFVEEIQVLKKGQALWWQLYTLSWQLFLVILIVKILLVSYEGYRATHKSNHEKFDSPSNSVL